MRKKHEVKQQRQSILTLMAFGLLIFLMAKTPFALASEIRNQFDVRIPMRDGVELSADIFMPEAEGQYPVLLMRTPYVKSARPPQLPVGKIFEYFASRGYVFVFQDVRGRGDSDGKFGYVMADFNDGYDTVEWIARQPWSNGKVGMMGVSYLGTVQWQAAWAKPPHLVCFVSTAAWGLHLDEDPYLGGAFRLEQGFNWINMVSARTDQSGVLGTVDRNKVYQHRPLLTVDEAMGRKMPLYREFLEHNTLDDWVNRSQLGPVAFRQIDMPVLHITGWFDGDQMGAMHYWEGMQSYSPAKNKQYLIVGPWDHVQTFFGGKTQLGDMEFTPDSVIDNLAVHLEFFEHYLKGSVPKYNQPRARVYVTGSNVWRDFDSYPPGKVESRRLYLHSGGRANSLVGDGELRWERPTEEEPPDRYTYDPKNPVPSYIGQQVLGIDHRPIERRDDVLVYTGDVLKEPLEIIGRVKVELFASTDVRDTDFTAKLVDVHADGRAIKLGQPCSGIIRARYRNGFEKEELLTPNKVEKFHISLQDIAHTFLPGHRVRLEISSSSFPIFAPNQNTGNPVATDTEWRIAQQTIFHDRVRPSHLILPIMPRGSESKAN